MSLSEIDTTAVERNYWLNKFLSEGWIIEETIEYFSLREKGFIDLRPLDQSIVDDENEREYWREKFISESLTDWWIEDWGFGDPFGDVDYGYDLDDDEFDFNNNDNDSGYDSTSSD